MICDENNAAGASSSPQKLHSSQDESRMISLEEPEQTGSSQVPQELGSDDTDEAAVVEGDKSDENDGEDAPPEELVTDETKSVAGEEGADSQEVEGGEIATEAKTLSDGDGKKEETKLLIAPPSVGDIIRRHRKAETESDSPESHQPKNDQEVDIERLNEATLTLPALSIISRGKSTAECAHQFEEHTYGAPTYCKVCDGLLVGLWSQGFQCNMCGMNVHRGQGLGDHDDCRTEALLTSCPGLGLKVVSANEPKVKLGDVIKDVRAIAKQSPNFFQDLSEQANRDIKAIAKDAIVATGVEEERSKNLRKIKARVVPFVQSADAIASHGEVYAFLFLLCIQILVALVVTVISLTAFVVVLWPRHGLLTDTSMRLAAVHDATVTAALQTIFAILALALHHLAGTFKRKANIIDRFLRDVFQFDAEADIGISIAGAADRTRAWSKRMLYSAVVGFVVASLLWHAMQPTSWEAATLPPLAGVFVPCAALLVCSAALGLIPVWKALAVPSPPSPTHVALEADPSKERTGTPISTVAPKIGKHKTR